MTSTNKPWSAESPKKAHVAVDNSNLPELLNESIKSELQNASGVIDPIFYADLKYPEIYAAIRNRMKYMRDIEDADITDSQIISISDAKIIEKIEKYARPLNNARKSLYRNIRQTFSGIRDKIPGFNEWILLQKIEWLDENEIVKLYHSNRTLAKFVSDYFSISRESLAFKDYDFMSIFGTDDLRVASPDLYTRTENAAMAYRNRGISPSLSLIRELIGYYGTANAKKKKEICEFFDIVIPLPDAVKSGFITDSDVETITKTEFSLVWNNLDPDARNALVQIIRYDDNYDIELASFDAVRIDPYFDSKKTKDVLTRAINNKFAKNEETVARSTGIARDLHAEVWPDGIPRIHQAFLAKVQDVIRTKDGISKISNIENLVVGSILIFQDESDKIRYFRIDATDVSIDDWYEQGVTMLDITGKEDGTIGNIKDTDTISYDDLYKFLSRTSSGRVITSQELISLQAKKWEEGIWQDHINGKDKILDISDTESVLTLEGFTREINLKDPDGEKIWLWIGVTFTSKWVLENGESYEWVWKIKSLNPPNIEISNRKGTEKATLDEFLTVVKDRWFRRIAQLETPDDLLKKLQEFGVDDHTYFEWENLITKAHVHDEHGHDKEVKKQYEFFQSKSGGHIRVNGFSDGLVSFGEYRSGTSLADVQKKWNAKKLSTEEKDGLYIDQTVSYGEFINYLKVNNMSATTDNILAPSLTDPYHPHPPHFEDDLSSFMSKVWSWWSVADIMKWFGNLTHGIEHYFEKSSKLNASRFALSVWRKFWLPLDIMAQLQADEVGSVKEIIEKIQEKLKNLNGPVARKKALHIAHNRHARPEEVGAAILHMLKWYGSLYAEDIAYAQGSESFINGLLTSCGFHGQALTDMKIKAREKSKVILGNEAGSDLSEEEMIWGFMKMMDGNSDKYPVAATLVKAMGGPSGFENAWRKDGFDGAYEKGIRQAGDLVNAEARVDHGLSALSTHEYHTAIWSMEQAASKDPSPHIQTLPVVWALWGYSKYLSTKANQKIKSYADGKWHSFHAFSFLRTRIDNDIYRHTFREALKDVAPGDVVNLDKWIKDLGYNGHEDPKTKWDTVKAAINGLAWLWRRHNGKLHDMLQGKNMWLVEKSIEDTEVKKYFDHLSSIHQNNSWNKAHSDDNGWYIQHWYAGSQIIESVNNKYTWWYTLNSMNRTLKKIWIDSHKLVMDENDKERYWDPIVKIVNNLSKSSQNDDLKRAQYWQYRRDILDIFNKAFSSKPGNFPELKKQLFYTDLLAMGIDISIIYEPGNINSKLEKWADKDYNAWKNGWYQGGGNTSNTERLSVSQTVQSVISIRQDAGYQWVGRNIDNRPDPIYNTDELWVGMPGMNTLSDWSGSD